MAEPTSFLSAALIYKSIAAGVAKATGQEGGKKLYQYVTARLKDGTIPANHDLQKAVEESLLEAARAFALGVAANLGEKPPLFEAMRVHFSEGRAEFALKELNRVEGGKWVKELLEEAKLGKDGKRGIAADFLIAEGNLPKLLADDKMSGSELETRVTKAFMGWLARHVQRTEAPACVKGFLKDGWPVEPGGKNRVTFYEAFVIFFREKIKAVPVVRDIFMAQTTSGISEDVKELLSKAEFTDASLQKGLEGHFSVLKSWLAGTLDRLQEAVDETNLGIRVVGAGVADGNAEVAKLKHEVKSLSARLLQTPPLMAYKRNLFQRFSPHRVLGLGANEPNKQKTDRDEITDLFVLPTCSESWLTPNAVEEAVNKGDAAAATALLPRLAKERLVVLLADPGMGKSTLIQWLVVTLTKKGAAPVEAVPFGRALPFPIILRDVMPHLQRLHPDPQDWTWQRLLDVFLDHYQPDGFTEPLARPLRAEGFDLDPVLYSPNAWFLVDGLDEVGSVKQREALCRVLHQGFATHRQARWLITSRVVGYAEAEVHSITVKGGSVIEIIDSETGKVLNPTQKRENDFKASIATLLYLAPWDNAQQKVFVRHWFIRRKGPQEGPPFGEEFIKAVRSHPGTAVIGRVPNVLLLMALFYRYRAFLPHGRAKVYQGISEAYLENIAVTAHIGHRQTEMELKQKERLLAIIAMHLQVKREEQQKAANMSGGSGDILASEEELKTWLCGEFGGKEDPKAVAAMKDFINHIADSSGILLPRGLGSYAFTHLSFQEYYAACWLELEFRRLLNKRQSGEGNSLFGASAVNVPHTDKVLTMKEDQFACHAEKSAWHEPLLFLAEKLGNENDVHTLMGWLFPWNDIKRPPLSAVAARLLATFSVDQQVELSDAFRSLLWDKLWGAWAKSHQAIENNGGVINQWPVESILLGAHPYFPLVQRSFRTHVVNAPGLSFMSCLRLGDLEELPATSAPGYLYIFHSESMKDLRWAKGLNGLRTLALFNCVDLIDLDVTSEWPSLTNIIIHGCRLLENLKPILKGRKIESLSAGGNDSLRLEESLAQVKSLKSLTLWSPHSDDALEYLTHIPSLEEIYLGGYSSKTPLQSLAHLSNLKRLTLQNHNLASTPSEVSGFLQLQSLKFINTNMGDLSPLRGLSNLQSLTFDYCAGVTEAAIRSLKEALPECKIEWFNSGLK